MRACRSGRPEIIQWPSSVLPLNVGQTATCEALTAQKNEQPSDKEKEAIQFLRNDSQARIAFINKIAAPVLNKMFDCGMIP